MQKTDRATEAWEVENLRKITAMAAALGFNVIFVPGKSQQATQRQLALGLIKVLIAECELENCVVVREMGL